MREVISIEAREISDCYSSIIRRNVRLARDLMRKKFSDQKNVGRYYLFLMSRENALNLARLYSRFPSFSISLSLFFYSVVPDARCSLRIIKVVANLDWRELRIQSLARCARKLVFAAQETLAGSLIGRDAV